MTIDDAAAWEAVLRRDRAFDGRFVTGVLTTGIYCRPSCPARHPARQNVRFFENDSAAVAAGLRACLRCKPDDLARDEVAVRQAIAQGTCCNPHGTVLGLACKGGFAKFGGADPFDAFCSAT